MSRERRYRDPGVAVGMKLLERRREIRQRIGDDRYREWVEALRPLIADRAKELGVSNAEASLELAEGMPTDAPGGPGIGILLLVVGGLEMGPSRKEPTP